MGPAAASRLYLKKNISIPCEADEKKELERLAARIQVNAAAIPLLSKRKCSPSKSKVEMSVQDFLKLGLIDEPDLGMDQNLPESADPKHDRKWMGGETGPTSQGFRHMVFTGMEWTAPVRSIQIPFHRVGQAFERIELLKTVSDSYLKSGDLFFGIRVLMWREHIIEDLLQPFHSTQIPNLSMLPWNRLLQNFVKRSTQAVANFHYAYEGIASELVRSAPESEAASGGFSMDSCFQGLSAHEYPGEKVHLALPQIKAREIGAHLYGVFGDYLKSESVNLPEGIGEVDYYQLLNAQNEMPDPKEMDALTTRDQSRLKRNEDLMKSLLALKTVTCGLMTELTAVFWGDLDQALSAVSNWSNTGK